MSKYTEVLTDNEVERIIASLPIEVGDKKIDDILSLLAFYGECKLVFDGVISGDIEIVGASENGLEYRTSRKAKRRLH